jgi:hypothetical protein
LNHDQQTRRFRAAACALSVGVLAVLAFASSASAAVVYDNIASPQPGNVASLGYEANSTSEWGGQIELAGAARKDPKVTVLMSSWGCQTGPTVTPPTPCVTTPGAAFTLPITLKLYAVNSNQSVGAAIATRTQTFAIPFRPSADPTCPTPSQWRDSTGTCFNGFATPITFNLAGDGITLPNRLIATIAYNTTSHGYRPIGAQSCGSNCGYDSLNVGAETAPPTVGTIPAAVAKDAYWATTHGPFYCDGGVGGVGFLRLDDCSSAALPAESWIENQISVEISASETEGEFGPIGPAGTNGANGATGATGAEGKEGKSGSTASVALKRKMSITFPKGTATLNGRKADVLVRCSGSTAQRCIGTLALKMHGTVQKAVYSVLKGQTTTVSVPLVARAQETSDSGTVVRAVARTEQTAGRPFRTARKLHLK